MLGDKSMNCSFHH